VAGAPRTKILEDRLRRARNLITKLQAQNPSPLLTTEVNGIFDSPPGSPSSASDTATGVADDNHGEYLENMMMGKGFVLQSQKSSTYYGASSCMSFLQKTLQIFSQHSSQQGSVPRELSQHILLNLFESPSWDTQTLQIDSSSSKNLPSLQTTSELLNTYFGNVYLLFQFLHEPSFRKQVERIYNRDLIDFEDLDHDFQPLFHSVMALGYLFSQKMHQNYGCKGALDQA